MRYYKRRRELRSCHLISREHLRTASSSSIIAYSPVQMVIRLTRAGPYSSSSCYAVCPLSPAPASFQRHWDMKEGSFIGSLVRLISSLITGHYSWVSDVSPLPRNLDMMHSDTLSPTNKQLPCGWTSEALTSGWGLFLDKWMSACVHTKPVWSSFVISFVHWSLTLH